MKKLMISTIILMPLLILAIMLVSGAILSIVTHIYVEKVEFVESATLILVMKDEDAPPAKQVDVNVFPLKADNRDLTYSVEDEAVASVDENGVVTANYFGETFVTVSSIENKAASAKRKVLVTDNTVHALKIKEFENDMYRGDSPTRLFVDVLPYEALNKQVTWSSSDESVLTVTESGDLICRGAGVVTVTVASVEKPEISDSVEIRCHEPLQGIAAEYPSAVTAAETAVFPTLTATPENATYTVAYSSSDEKIATVNERGEINFLQAGTVTITATATDGRAHTDSVSVRYHCTNGYYMGALFEKTAYTFDYDAHFGRVLNEVVLNKTLDGSYREIVDVTFSKPGILSFDEKKETFSLSDVSEEKELGEITVTIRAKKYDYDTATIKEFVTDICNITITRKAKSISFVSEGQKVASVTTEESISFGEGNFEGGIGILASPKNHTDALSFSIEGDATIKNGSTLVFTKEGEYAVRVTAKATDDEGNVNAQADLTVSRVEPKDSEKDISVGSATQEELSLSLNRNGTKETGVLSITAPEGTTPHCVSDHPEILGVDETGVGVRLVPKKGGFATVTIEFTPSRGDNALPLVSAQPGQLKIYVNKAVSDGNISFSFENGRYTAKDSFRYQVMIDAANDAMEGKQLFVDGVEAQLSYRSGKYVADLNKTFQEGENAANIQAQVLYNEEAQKITGKTLCAFATCKLRTTHGKLRKPPKVTYGETELAPKERTELTFSDIGESLTLVVDAASATPADFRLSQEAISFTTDMKFDFTVKMTQSGTAKITIKATEGGEEETTLTVAGQEYKLLIKVAVQAHTIAVKFGETELDGKTDYTTLLSKLPLTVVVGREDEHTITDTKLLYSLDGGTWHEQLFSGKVCNLTIVLDGRGEVKFKCGKAEITLKIQKLDLASLNLSYHIEYSADGALVTLDEFTVEGENKLEFSFPNAIQGHFELVIKQPELQNNLGGFDEGEMKKFFSLTHKDSTGEEWAYNINAETLKIEVKIPTDKTYFMGEELLFRCGEKSVTLVLNCADFVRVEMEGFDNTVNSNVYLGYQQVRVFAKQSQYKTGEKVDYFRVPLKAIKDVTDEGESGGGDPASIVWSLTKVSDKESTRRTQLLSDQRDRKVEADGKTYTIEKASAADGEDGACRPSTLKDEDGHEIAKGGKFVNGERIPWIDVFAEAGYAHIYFGNFGGLSEVDVQNDYFGNFGDKAEWTKVADNTNNYDQSGRNFQASENAYSFLRIDAGDGAKDSKAGTHFNFNVLEDSNLVNVFDAEGYNQNSNVVLQTNLYGEGELGTSGEEFENATKKGLFLKDAAKLDKTLIYGNGYQVNFQAKNAEIVADMTKNPNSYKNGFNESKGVKLEKAYNTVIKGANPDQNISGKIQTIVLKMSYAYYCDLSYYYKFNPANSIFYTKNTVFSCIPKTAIQLYYNNNALYAENIVMTECGTAIQADNTGGQNVKIYFKGTVDILNYFNRPALTQLNALIGGMFSEVVPQIKDYFEWHGKNISASTQSASGSVDEIYVNILAFAYSKLDEKTFIWSDNGYKKISEGSALSSGAKIVCKDLIPIFQTYYALTYEMMNGGARLDKATATMQSNNFTGTADMNSLFSDGRYIRLQCQFKKPGEKNFEHMEWHKQNVYRDLTLIEGRKTHIEDLKESLKGVQWEDGSGVDKDGVPYEPKEEAAKLAAMISETVLPEKRVFA